MKKNIFLFFVIYFIGIVVVEAAPNTADINVGDVIKIREADITTTSVKSSVTSKECVSESDTSENITGMSTSIYLSNTKIIPGCDESYSYNVVILVDISGSMKVGNRVGNTNRAIANILGELDSLDNGTGSVNLVKFGGMETGDKTNVFYDLADRSATGWLSIRNAYNRYKNTDNSNRFIKKESEGEKYGDYTDLQYPLYKAWSLLEAKNSGNQIPIVIFITDGYPTQGFLNANFSKMALKANYIRGGTNEFYGSGSSGPRRVFWVARTFNTLKSKLLTLNKQAKVITVGIDLGDTAVNPDGDQYAKFLLNPSAETYEGLNSNTPYHTGVKALRDYIDGKTIYTYEIKKNSYPDAGEFFGYPSGDYIYFDMTKTRLDQFIKSNGNGNGTLYYQHRFHLYVNEKHICRVWGTSTKGRNKNEPDCGLKYDSETGKYRIKRCYRIENGKCVNVPKTGDKMKNDFPGTSWFKIGENKIVDASIVNSSSTVADRIAGIVRDAIQCKQEPKTENGPVKTYTKTHNKSNGEGIQKFNSSVKVNINLKEIVPSLPDFLYYNIKNKKFSFDNGEITDLKFYKKENGKTISDLIAAGKGTDCVKIRASLSTIPLLITEKSTLTVKKPTEVPYIGSGFNTSATIVNDFTVRYASLIKGGAGVTVSLVGGKYYLVKGNKDDYDVVSNITFDNGKNAKNSGPIEFSIVDNVKLGDIYTDDKCSNPISANTSFGQKIMNKLDDLSDTRGLGKGRKLDKNIRIFQSVDSNNYLDSNNTVKTSIVKTTTTLDKYDNSNSTDGNVNFHRKYFFNVNLNTSCIARKYLNEQGTKYNNGSIKYLDTIANDCGQNYILGVNELKQTLYYIPIDYPSNLKTVDFKTIGVNGVNLSNHEGIVINHKLSCSTTVKGKELKYNYRSINVNNPFPKKVPSNWSKWYKENPNRLGNTFSNIDKPLYSIHINKYDNNDASKNSLSDVRKFNDTSYTNWDHMLSNGKSNVVCPEVNTGSGLIFGERVCNSGISYCNLGEFSKGCDNDPNK